MLRRLRMNPLRQLMARVDEAERHACGQATCCPQGEEPADEASALLRPPPVRQDRVDAMAEGSEMSDRGRRWVRLPGGKPVLVADMWTGFSMEPEWTGREIDPDTLPGSDGGDQAPVQFAINSAHLFHKEDEGEDRYGSASRIVEDCHGLGVGVLRQPGKAQLFLDFLLGAGREDGIPVRFASYDAVAGEIIADESQTLRRLKELAILLRDRGMTVYVTILTLGGGSAAADAVVGDDVIDGVAGKIGSSPRLFWHRDWRGKGLKDDLADDAAAPLEFNRLDEEWDLVTMDPGNPCKRLVYRWVCRAVAEWMERNRDELEGVIAGVEIGNELDVRHIFTSGSSGDLKERTVPEHWGPLYAECAVEMRSACDWVPLWLPGIASYNDDGDVASRRPGDFWGKVNFVGELLGAIQKRLDEIGGDWLLADLVAGVDLHWYHSDAGASRRAVLLPLELQAVRKKIEASLRGTPSEGHQVELTLIEAGSSMVCDDLDAIRDRISGAGQCEGEGFSSSRAHLRPPQYTSARRGSTWVSTELHAVQLLEQVGPLDWQAWTMARQLLMALAGGVRVVGTHGHISTPPQSAFEGYGIRRDLANVAKASDAWLRPAGAMLSRLSDVFGGLTGEVELLHPTVLDSDRPSFDRQRVGEALAGGSYPVENFACVLGFRGLYDWTRSRSGLLRLGGYGTVLFLDSVPGANEPGDPTPGAMVVRLLMTGEPTVWRVYLEAAAMFTEPASTDDDFPISHTRYESTETVETSRLESWDYTWLDVPIHRGEAPVLLLSSAPLRVERVFVLPEAPS